MTTPVIDFSSRIMVTDSGGVFWQAIVTSFVGGGPMGTSPNGRYTTDTTTTPFSAATYARPTGRGSYVAATNSGTKPTGNPNSWCTMTDFLGSVDRS